MSVPATCPFCNALVPANAPAVDGRVACPRCGETVGTVKSAPGTTASSSTPSNVPAARSTRRVSVWALILVLVAVGLWAVSANWHRFRSPFGNPTPPAKPVVVQPTDLPGLGYLPESTDVILAVQMPFLLQRLGPEADDDPVQALTALGLPRSAAHLLDEASAVGLKNVDHLVVGLGFETHAMPPQVTIVVHARRPFDLDGLARQEKARPLKRDGRKLYVARAGPLPEIFWWKAADRVLVATILQKDFDAVPAQPRAGVDHLRPALTNLIREAVAEDACAWFTASSDRWHQYLRPYTLPLLPTPLRGRTDLLKPAEQLRTVAVSVPNDAEKSIDIRIGLKSADAADALRTGLAERFAGEPIQVTGREEWTKIEVPNDPVKVGPLVGRLTGLGQ